MIQIQDMKMIQIQEMIQAQAPKKIQVQKKGLSESSSKSGLNESSSKSGLNDSSDSKGWRSEEPKSGLNDSSDSKGWRGEEPKRDSVSNWNSELKNGLNDSSSSSKTKAISSSYDLALGSNSSSSDKASRMDTGLNNFSEPRNFELDTNSGMGFGTTDPAPNNLNSKDAKTNSWLDNDSKSDSKKSFWE